MQIERAVTFLQRNSPDFTELPNRPPNSPHLNTTANLRGIKLCVAFSGVLSFDTVG